jgi:hypothetical protein
MNYVGSLRLIQQPLCLGGEKPRPGIALLPVLPVPAFSRRFSHAEGVKP